MRGLGARKVNFTRARDAFSETEAMRIRGRVDLDVIPPGLKDLSQWHSRPAFAGRVADFARVRRGDLVLEPSAGIGRLARFIPRSASLTAIEIDARLVAHLVAHGRQRDWMVIRADFLAWAAWRVSTLRVGELPFDVAVMNPPFENDQDAAHMLAALSLCRRVVAVVRAQFLFGSGRGAAIWQWYRHSRIAIAENRPPFDGVLEASGSPRHDFIVVEIVPRVDGEMGKPDPVEVERWADKW